MGELFFVPLEAGIVGRVGRGGAVEFGDPGSSSSIAEPGRAGTAVRRSRGWVRTPYFEAAGKMTRRAYAVNPSNTTNYSSSPTGTPVISSRTASPFSPSSSDDGEPVRAGHDVERCCGSADWACRLGRRRRRRRPGRARGAVLPPGMVPPGFVPGQGNGSPMQGSGGD